MFDVIKKDQKVRVLDLGLISYQDGWNIQKEEVKRVRNGESMAVIVCEHPPVLTMGRTSRKEHLLASPLQLEHLGIDVVNIDRGGDVTLHAPGQVIMYPVLDLNFFGRDLHAYLHQLEDVGQEVLKSFGLSAIRNEINTGLWAGSKKIMSIGIGVKHWVTYHGLGLNVSTDLALFGLIKPCGLDVNMTSMERELGQSMDVSLVKIRLIDCFLRQFQLK